MKIKLLISLILFFTINLDADKNWIEIKPLENTKSKSTDAKLDLNISQVKPINNIIKNATALKQLIDAKRKEKPTTNEKNWFALDNQ